MIRTRVRVAGTVNGASVMTHHWLAPEDSTGSTDVRQALGTFLFAIQGLIRVGTTLDIETEAEIVDPASGMITGTLPLTSGSFPGTDTGDQLPVMTQGLVRWRTGVFVGGREVRGRTFVPSPTEDKSTMGKPTALYTGGLQTAAQAMADDEAAGLAVWSRARGQAHPVSTATVWSEWSGLRSRRD